MNQIGVWINKLKGFLKETRLETQKVVWPSRRYVATATLIVLFMILAIGLLIMGIDVILARIFTYIFL